MDHFLKCEREYFNAIATGQKTFELRKNDRDFKVGDTVYLEEWHNGGRCGSLFDFKIKYILYGGKFGLPEGYCIFNW